MALTGCWRPPTSEFEVSEFTVEMSGPFSGDTYFTDRDIFTKLAQ